MFLWWILSITLLYTVKIFKKFQHIFWDLEAFQKVLKHVDFIHITHSLFFYGIQHCLLRSKDNTLVNINEVWRHENLHLFGTFFLNQAVWLKSWSNCGVGKLLGGVFSILLKGGRPAFIHLLIFLLDFIDFIDFIDFYRFYWFFYRFYWFPSILLIFQRFYPFLLGFWPVLPIFIFITPHEYSAPPLTSHPLRDVTSRSKEVALNIHEGWWILMRGVS